MPRWLLLFLSSLPALAATSTKAHYVGSQVCAGCHADIARKQAASPMATSWHGAISASIPLHYSSRIADPPWSYNIRRASGQLLFSLTRSSGRRMILPVETVIGDPRSSFSFLIRIAKLDDIPLDRPALIDARYVWTLHDAVPVLSPLVGTEKPSSLETAFGRVLSPTAEQKCLTCHGAPGTLGAGSDGGVQCESCHGPGSAHVDAVAHGTPREGIVHPDCTQCHSGLKHVSDPLPDDLLLFNQVTALRSSECFIQSGERIACTSCHDAHQSTAHDAERSVHACLACHSSAAKPHAAICPVNATADCLGCHMPAVDRKPFRVTDHWIRIHPEQAVKSPAPNEALRSQIPPLREFLRIIVADNRDKADEAAQRLSKGEPFADVARFLSGDPSAEIGGYIGDTRLADLDPKLAAAAAALRPRDTSSIVDLGNRWIILHRMARDFKLRSARLQQEASGLKDHGDIDGALARCLQALNVYPYSLRSLNFMVVTLAQNKQPSRAAAVAQVAAHLYPDDATVQFNAGLTFAALGRRREEMEAYARAIELDPDVIAFYETLGASLYSAGQVQRALDTFRAGLRIDPLSAKLYYDVGLILRQADEELAAKRAIALASAIDPTTPKPEKK